MKTIYLHLLLLLQFMMTPVFAQDSSKVPETPAPVLPNQPSPKPRPPLCKIEAKNGLTWLTWNGRIITRPTSDFSLTLNQLKELGSKKMCVYHTQRCSLMAKQGRSGISIESDQDGELQFRQAADLSPEPLVSLRDLQMLKDSGLCKIVVPTYSVLFWDGSFAVYINANRATELTTNEADAQKDLILFTEPINTNLFNSLPFRKVTAEVNTQTRIQNLKCWTGKSLTDREKNLKLCLKAGKYNQTCEISHFVHNEGNFDVCLQGFKDKPNQVSQCTKSNSKAQLKENMAHCKTMLQPGQICETDPEVHGHEKNEVCILE